MPAKAKSTYDYRLRAKIDDLPLETLHSANGDYFAWFEGEVVTLEIKHKDHILNIKLDERGNVSLKRHINPRAIQ
jgi:hypothetical protein